jgi:hypothetical protein
MKQRRLSHYAIPPFDENTCQQISQISQKIEKISDFSGSGCARTCSRDAGVVERQKHKSVTGTHFAFNPGEKINGDMTF